MNVDILNVAAFREFADSASHLKNPASQNDIRRAGELESISNHFHYYFLQARAAMPQQCLCGETAGSRRSNKKESTIDLPIQAQTRLESLSRKTDDVRNRIRLET